MPIRVSHLEANGNTILKLRSTAEIIKETREKKEN